MQVSSTTGASTGDALAQSRAQFASFGTPTGTAAAQPGTGAQQATAGAAGTQSPNASAQAQAQQQEAPEFGSVAVPPSASFSDVLTGMGELMKADGTNKAGAEALYQLQQQLFDMQKSMMTVWTSFTG